MPVIEEARKALDLQSLTLPPGIPVLSVEVNPYTDWTGDEALRVLVVVDDALDDDKIDGKAVGDLKTAIHDSLLERGITLFPYIFLAKPSELAARDEE